MDDNSRAKVSKLLKRLAQAVEESRKRTRDDEKADADFRNEFDHIAREVIRVEWRSFCELLEQGGFRAVVRPIQDGAVQAQDRGWISLRIQPKQSDAPSSWKITFKCDAPQRQVVVVLQTDAPQKTDDARPVEEIRHSMEEITLGKVAEYTTALLEQAVSWLEDGLRERAPR
jgi:hypothetical protein